MTSILVVGVAVVDFIFHVADMPRRPVKYRAEEALISGGGCAANAAAQIARLGGTAILASRLGDDMIGDLIVNGLTSDGVDCAMVRRFAGKRSPFSSVFVDRAGERQIVSYRDMSIGFEAEWVGETAPPSFDAVLADTRWGLGAAAAMQLARARGVAGILDAEAPVGEAAEAFGAATHIAFSAQGLEDYCGGGARCEDVSAALARPARQTGAFVCVTDGAAGVFWQKGEARGHVPAFAVDAVDTLGAGDVWHGAFALRLAEGAGEAEAIGFANAVAAIKCTRRNGRDGFASRAETETFLKERTK